MDSYRRERWYIHTDLAALGGNPEKAPQSVTALVSDYTNVSPYNVEVIVCDGLVIIAVHDELEARDLVDMFAAKLMASREWLSAYGYPSFATSTREKVGYNDTKELAWIPEGRSDLEIIYPSQLRGSIF